MALKVNKHGLRRHIPAAVAREVRKRCGFGCVVCGKFPCEYDHFTVPFAEAKEHRADDIVLLCKEHHAHKTHGFLKRDVIEMALRRRQAGDVEFLFKLDLTSKDFRVHWPFNELISPRQSILVDGVPILTLDVRDDPLQPVLLSGTFTDFRGNDICVIEENAFTSQASVVGDFVIRGNRFSYVAPGGRRSLVFDLDSSGLHIREIFHVRADAYVRSLPDCLVVGNVMENVRLYDCLFEAGGAALSIIRFSETWDFELHDLTAHNYGRELFRMRVTNEASGDAVEIAAPRRPKRTYSFQWGW